MTLNTIKNALFAAMHGMTPEEFTLQKARESLTNAAADFLDQHPEYLRAKQTTTPAAVSKTTKIYKMLGSDSRPLVAHTADHIDPEVLERAKAACRKLVADNPERYGNIIPAQEA
ncbi:hypothetical protein [Pseudocitrobacter vendiensis]|uniref:Uncharacterized protein n=1 Tax=Pseudocitrobacter vendiensis TaxID=2488306 RepID=A0ABN8TAR9_9ENTR|nr:hypothetical protein [Pseudocitrobacter vendiensis]CAH6659903.1 hypothetical protein FBBNIHIM_12320 [Pseudocitrobacter vendiensis]